jgi:GT2 family glycosyltransferase
MPTFGRWEWTAQALNALHDNTEPVYELIVVDNASPDGTPQRLAETCENVRIVRNANNLGFALACNQGVEEARGAFLVFLNSDALVHAGWLAPLLETASNPAIGAAGPRFLNPDGSVQEAGALLFRDVLTGAYGRGEPDATGELRRPRAVDYVSAACLMVDPRAFDEVGGFDPLYGAAYFEDVDLCLSLAAHGYRTAYEPRSVVTHVHGWSEKENSNDVLLDRNRSLFARRWSDLLLARPFGKPGGSRQMIAARDAPSSDRLLVADLTFERGALAARELATLCPEGHVALLSADPSGQSHDLLEAGIEVADGAPEPGAVWLANRRFHYDIVLTPAPLPRPLEEAIRTTQPQAARLTDSDPATLAEAFLDLGIALRTDRYQPVTV